MFGFGEVTASFDDLTSQERDLVVAYCEANEEYLKARMIENGLRKRAAQDPTPANAQELDTYSTVMMSPASRAKTEAMYALLAGAVDVPQIKEMLPMLLAAFLNNIKLPMVFAIFDNEEAVDYIANKIKEFISSDKS